MKRLALLFLMVFAACGGPEKLVDINGDGIGESTDPRKVDSVTQVAPISPKGRISGRVVDLHGAPLQNAAVKVSGPTTVEVVTDANGLFQADKLTAGSLVGVLVSATGYAPAWSSMVVPSDAGNFPLNDGEAFVGTFHLVPTGGSVAFHVVGWDGKAIAATAAVLDVNPGFLFTAPNPGGAPSRSTAGDISVTATVADGALSFSGIPNPEQVAFLSSLGTTVRYALYVAPVKDEGGAPVYGGRILTLTAAELLTEPYSRTIVLPPATETDELAILGSNVYNLKSIAEGKGVTLARENLVPTSGPISVVFNQPISKDAFVEIRVDEPPEGGMLTLTPDPTYKESVLVAINTPELNATGTILKITPKTPGLTAGRKYNLTISATARDNPTAKTKKFVAPFFAGDPGAAKPLSTPTAKLVDASINAPGQPWAGDSAWAPAETIEIYLSHYIGRPDASSLKIPVYFDNDINADGKFDAPGEKGSNNPICVPGAEAVPSWQGAKASGYARRFLLSKALVTTPFAPVANPTVTNLTLVIAFNEAYKCGGPLHTIWDEAITTNATGLGITTIAPDPLP